MVAKLKIALVDIDGCAVIKGEINPGMVDKLKNGQYDRILLFTQRNTFIQVAQISHAYGFAESLPDEDTIITTVDAVEQLSALVKQEIEVSTTVDRFFGLPLNYYRDHLAPFENDLKIETLRARKLSETMVDIDRAPFAAKIEQEAQQMRDFLGPNHEKTEMIDMIPHGKVEQYLHLIQNLEGVTEDTQIDYFDDRLPNLDEFLNEEISHRPNLYLVSKTYVAPLATFDNQKAPERDTEKLPFVQAKMKYIDRGFNPSISKLLAKYVPELDDIVDQLSSDQVDKNVRQAKIKMQNLFKVTGFLKGEQLEADDLRLVRQFALANQDFTLLAMGYASEFGESKGMMIAQCTMKLNEEIQKNENADPDSIKFLDRTIIRLKQTEEQQPNFSQEDTLTLSRILPELELPSVQAPPSNESPRQDESQDLTSKKMG